MSFKEYYMKKHNMEDWNYPDELVKDVMERICDTLAEYVDEKLK